MLEHIIDGMCQLGKLILMTRFINRQCVACGEDLAPDEQIRISVHRHNDQHIFCPDCAEPVLKFLAQYELLEYQRFARYLQQTA